MGMVNPNKLGLVLGALYGGWHLLWAMLVGIGWAQSILNFRVLDALPCATIQD
jgi:hypothetical protein